MSGIFGVLRRDGCPVYSSELEAMADMLSHRGPDGRNRWSDGAFGLGHLMLRTTPESFHERFPLIDRTGELCVTADVRLDNRDELIGLLRPFARDRSEITDGELILAAYERWGEGCVEKFLGDFALAVWKSREKTLFLARDRFGVKPLFYYSCDRLFAFASEIKAFFVLPNVQRRINEQMVADHLTGAHLDREMTFYKDVVRMPPAHTITVSAGAMRQRSYWALDPERELKLRSDEEYAEAFRERFTEAVRCRLRSPFKVGSTLSGGLDSSSIASVAHGLLSKRGGQLLSFSLVFDEIPECDEGQFINAVVARCGFQSRRIRADSLGPLSGLERSVWHWDSPVSAPNLFLHWALYSAANLEGIRVVLDGFDGDSVVSHGYQFLNELASRKRWLKLAVETVALSRSLGVSPWPPLRQYVQHFGFDPVVTRSNILKAGRRVWRRLTRPEMSTPSAPQGTHWRDLLTPGFVQRLGLEDRYRAWRRIQPQSARTEREGHFRILTQPSLPMAFDIFDSTAASSSTEARYPFWDTRLVEFCLALPPEQKLHRGLGRIVMRRALADLLPPEIHRRKRKTNFIPVFNNGLVSVDRQLLEAILEDTSDLECYLDTASVRRLCDRVTDGDRPGSAADSMSLWRVLSLAQWLRAASPHRRHAKEVRPM